MCCDERRPSTAGARHQSRGRGARTQGRRRSRRRASFLLRDAPARLHLPVGADPARAAREIA
jgi:hypothetical protein